MVEVDVADGNAPAVGERETGVVTRSRAEYHHVADRGGQVFAQNADVAVGAFFGRDRPVRQPVVRGTERRFAPHGVELQQVGEGVHRTLGIAETQAAVDDVAEVIFGELDFQPTVALRHNGALGIERTGEVDRQVAHRNVLTVFEAERRDEAREEQFGAVAVDLEVAHTHQVERDALEALVVVADELVLFDRPVGAHAEPAAGQHEPRGADLGTVFQRGPHGVNPVGEHVRGDVIALNFAALLRLRLVWGLRRDQCGEGKIVRILRLLWVAGSREGAVKVQIRLIVGVDHIAAEV